LLSLIDIGSIILFVPSGRNNLGFEIEVLDIASCDRETAQAKIFQSKILYISGGNTFYLLQELKKISRISISKPKSLNVC